MDKPFRKGLVVGLLGPLAFAAGVLYWVYRSTHKIPFPISAPAEGQLVISLVEPSEVSSYWQPWRQSLCDVRNRFVSLAREIKSDLENAEG